MAWILGRAQRRRVVPGVAAVATDGRGITEATGVILAPLPHSCPQVLPACSSGPLVLSECACLQQHEVRCARRQHAMPGVVSRPSSVAVGARRQASSATATKRVLAGSPTWVHRCLGSRRGCKWLEEASRQARLPVGVFLLVRHGLAAHEHIPEGGRIETARRGANLSRRCRGHIHNRQEAARLSNACRQ